MLNRRTLLGRGALSATAAVTAPAAIAGLADAVSTPTAQAAPAQPRSFYIAAGGNRHAIRALQNLLTVVGHETADDGIYGAATSASVAGYQAAAGLVVDGLAGPLTMGSLLGREDLYIRASLHDGPILRAVRALIEKNSGAAAVVGGEKLAEDEIAWLGWFGQIHGVHPRGVLGGPTLWSYLFDAPERSDWSIRERSLDEPFRYLPISGGRVILDQLTQEQIRNGQLMIAVGKKHNIPAVGIQAAIATIMVETWMYNRYEITDHDSSGLFQQRPSWSWGSYPQVRDKVLATEAFYGVGAHSPNPGVRQFAPTEGDSIGELAQDIQHSAFPERYENRAPDAVAFYELYVDEVAPLA